MVKFRCALEGSRLSVRGILIVLAFAGLIALGAIHLAGCRSNAEAKPSLGFLHQGGSGSSQQALATDPQLLAYCEIEQVKTDIEEPCGLALGPDGRLYVAGDKIIRIFDKDHLSRSDIRLASAPRALAVADDGTIYVAMLKWIEVYDSDGTRLATWQAAGERAHFTSVTVNGEDVWVGDAGDRVVLRYDRNGQLRGRIGEKDKARGVPGLVMPGPHLDAAAAPDGLIWVNNSGRRVVEVYTVGGDLKSSWGESSSDIEGFCGCCNPTDIALLPDGKVVTSEKGLPRIKVYWPDGRLESLVAGQRGFAKGVVGLDLAVDSAGRILALDPGAKTIRVFERRKEAEP